MTKLIYEHGNRDWILTDEASSCSYGEPVLVADDGTQMRATEVAYIAPAWFDEPGFEPTPITAWMIAGNRANCRSSTLSNEEWEMTQRFRRQIGA